MLWVAIAIFALTYAVILGYGFRVHRLDRASGAILGAVAMVASGVLTPAQAYRDAVDHATIVLLLGMMCLTGYLEFAGFFRWASWRTLQWARTPRSLLVGVTLVSGVLSALVVNDTVCLLLTPLVLRMVDDAKLPVEPYLFAVAFGANAGSAATPTGNPQNMIIATRSGLGWLEFVGALGLPAAGALAVVVVVLLVAYRRELAAATLPDEPRARPALDTALLARAGLAFGVVAVGFALGFELAFTALTGAAVVFVLGRRPPSETLGQVDWLLLVFFAGLFVVVHGLGVSGAAAPMLAPLTAAAGSEPLQLILSWGAISVVASQLLSNVPYVMLASQAVPGTHDPALAWEVLALASTLAGNLTLVGSVANLIVFSRAGARGEIGLLRFLRVGIPTTALSLAVGLSLLWLVRVGLRGG